DEPPTPLPPSTAKNKLAPTLEKKNEDNPAEVTSTTQLLNDSKDEINNENESDSLPIQEQKVSRASSQSDIQFKL
ncbi:unnamed protein product, partial [Rotaria magnacalcarata]